MAVTGNDGKVDLDEVRRGADGRLGQHSRRSGIRSQVRRTFGRCERGELGDVGGRLADLQRHLCRPDERRAEGEVALLRLYPSVRASSRGRVSNAAGVVVAESRQPRSQEPLPARDPGAVRPRARAASDHCHEGSCHGCGDGCGRAPARRRSRRLERVQKRVETAPAGGRRRGGLPARSPGEALAQVLDDDGARLDSGSANRHLEVGHNGCPEGGVRLGALDERIELNASQRQLLCCGHPSGRGRRKQA